MFPTKADLLMKTGSSQLSPNIIGRPFPDLSIYISIHFRLLIAAVEKPSHSFVTTQLNAFTKYDCVKTRDSAKAAWYSPSTRYRGLRIYTCCCYRISARSSPLITSMPTGSAVDV